MSILLLIYLGLIHSICYLLLHDKLPQNMASLKKNHHKYLLYHNFCGSEILLPLSWVLGLTVLHKASIKVQTGAAVSQGQVGQASPKLTCVALVSGPRRLLVGDILFSPTWVSLSLHQAVQMFIQSKGAKREKGR